MRHHGAGLRRILEAKRVEEDEQRELLAGLERDHTRCDLSEADRAMLDYAAKLTETPRSVSIDDAGRLRQVGFDDRGIHDICSIAAYFAFVNRIADGLGVELETTS